MIQGLARFQSKIAFGLLMLFYCDIVLAGMDHYGDNRYQYTYHKNSAGKWYGFKTSSFNKAIVENESNSIDKERSTIELPASAEKGNGDLGGPSQPEMQSFTSVNASNMVDLFSGDFSYNIPLLDVGGYPVNIAYRGGITMDQEASWVGLGWNINPGTISRNMRGLPDDFDGKADTITKTTSVKENKTIGVTAGIDAEIVGLPKGAKLDSVKASGSAGASLGIFSNSYKGWGIETGLNASLNAGAKSAGGLTAGLSITNNSQEGITVSPSLSVKLQQHDKDTKSGTSESFSISSPYNSRSGMKGLQVSMGVNQYKSDNKNQSHSGSLGNFSSTISFASPSFTPTISMPYTSSQFSFTAKLGTTSWVIHPSVSLTGYVSKQTIEDEDKVVQMPAYGYLNFQNSNNNSSSLLDFNREKEIPYREKPAIPHIGVPGYTYDVFSITGEGTGGMFRAYRGDVGFVYDHFMKTKDNSTRLSVDVGIGNLVHGGIDLNLNRSYSQSGPWKDQNVLGKTLAFRSSNGLFEAAYFRNPGEKSINDKSYYEGLGGDDVVTPDLYQSTVSSSNIMTTNYLNKYRNKNFTEKIAVTQQSVTKQQRDKRAQVISYLNAREADAVGLNKYIESYTLNSFKGKNCGDDVTEILLGPGDGLNAAYYRNENFSGNAAYRKDVNIAWNGNFFPGGSTSNHFSAIWTGRLKAPVTGTYVFKLDSDDGMTLSLNGVLIIDKPSYNPTTLTGQVNLVAGQLYDIKVTYTQYTGPLFTYLKWSYPGQTEEVVPQKYLYSSAPLDHYTQDNVTLETRVNGFRKATHISEIDVLNNDGRKYVYGIPVYNTRQKETTFSIDNWNGNNATGLAAYNKGQDNSTGNNKGKDHYYTAEEIPPYAHSYLLTGILSPDYVDITGDGISDDDLGDAVKFNYTRTAGIGNAYKWRAPYITDSATYAEGLRTDNRDDKANYIYGEKEVWYLNSITSKNMVAAFFLEDRADALEIDENGTKTASGKTKRLRKIALYNKAEFLVKDTLATPIKTVYFEYSYELCRGINRPVNDSGKLTLKKIWFSYNGNNKGQLNPYVFNYHSNNPSYNIKSYDRWGNYKDPNENPSTSGVVSNADYPYTIQDTAITNKNVAAWTLNEVKLPSGGRIKVDYESDDYAYVQNRRAMQMFKIAGFGSSIAGPITNAFYQLGGDNLYVFVNVPVQVSSNTDLLKKYLDDIKKIYFRLYVKVPGDQWGSGYEYIPCYAEFDEYGFTSKNTIWIKLKGVNKDGSLGGSNSPLAKASLQFLKLNLPSKAYPGSEPGDNVDVVSILRVLATQVTNIVEVLSSFDRIAKGNGWMKYADLNRSLIRLTNPSYKKLGGGSRVKRVTVYDNWNAMTSGNRPEATYGQEYIYTTTQEVNGKQTIISSGVASYEPGIGGEENPFHLPIEYTEKVSLLGPTTQGYTEEPLGESFFPSAGVGYSKVTVRSIHTKGTRSANGYQETKFFTAYDFPTFVDWSTIDNNTKKRFKPSLSNFLRIDAKQFLTISQGFKVELNDMHGKMRSQATYPENDSVHYISYTENFYKTARQPDGITKLSNEVTVIKPDGTIDTTALIGKDVEVMMDMREQQTVVNGANVSVNADVFMVGVILTAIPSFWPMPQREETKFRSAAATKIIQRYGILDSVISIDKGSRVSTRNILYDSETGDVVLTRTQNEFNDPIFNFSYPSHWAYEGMGMAYQNIGATLTGIDMRNGLITQGLPVGTTAATFFSSGDELLIDNKPKTATGSGCTDSIATFPVLGQKIWAIDANVVSGGTKSIYFIDKDGNPYTGNNITLKITRSGRRNMGSGIGAVTTMANPMVYNGTTHQYSIQLDSSSQVINASVAKFKQLWKTEDKKTGMTLTGCIPYTECSQGYDSTCLCECLKPLFDYMLAYQRLGILPSDNITVASVVHDAITAGYAIDSTHCPIIKNNMKELLYTLTPQLIINDGTSIAGNGPYKLMLGSCVLKFYRNDRAFFENQLADFTPKACVQNKVEYTNPTFTGTCSTWEYKLSNIQDSLPYAVYVNCENAVDTIYLKADTLLHKFCARSVSIHDFYNSVAEVLNIVSDCEFTPVSDATFATLEVESCGKCIPDTTFLCYSAITDTVVNPYAYGILGNFRPDTAYVYYGRRKESDPAVGTNIRHNGAFKDYTPFWQFQSGKLKADIDTTRWVWNSTITMFNKRGFELESKDPLGRYNSGLYGYNQTLPTAVIQNSRYRETAFEGFEDYAYTSNSCDVGCPIGKHFDFTVYKAFIDSTQQHTGKYSLRIPAETSKGIAARIVSTDSINQSFVFGIASNSCATNYLQSLHADSSSLLPIFSPLAGKRFLFSAWVKEDKDCKCEQYQDNEVAITIGTTSGDQVTQCYPTGNIIEGWQRYERAFTIPSNATSISISLMATGSSDVFFDDIRILPFNANMKSFVYHPVNLRLMAELDENNYATFYEYDDDGTLVRVKKETERGIKTIKETRSALRKDE